MKTFLVIDRWQGGKLLAASKEVKYIYGYGEDELEGKSILDTIIHPTTVDVAREHLAEINAPYIQRYENVNQRNDGRAFPIVTDVAELKVHDQPLVFAEVRVNGPGCIRQRLLEQIEQRGNATDKRVAEMALRGVLRNMVSHLPNS